MNEIAVDIIKNVKDNVFSIGLLSHEPFASPLGPIDLTINFLACIRSSDYSLTSALIDMSQKSSVE